MSNTAVKIGFIGAPGSGKTKVVKALAKETEELLGHKPVVVDGYVDKLSKDVDLAFGQFATYSENLMIAGIRQAAFQKATKTGRSVFHVGTLIESFLYQAMVADGLMRRTNPDAAARAATTAMGSIGLMMAEMLDYDAIIYLPYAPKEGKAEHWNFLVDGHIQDVTTQFQIPISIVEGTISERVQKLKAVVEYAHAQVSQLEASDGQAEDEGGEVSE